MFSQCVGERDVCVSEKICFLQYLYMKSIYIQLEQQHKCSHKHIKATFMENKKVTLSCYLG